MADDSSSPATGEPNYLKSEPATAIPSSNPSPTPRPQQHLHPQAAALAPTQTQVFQPGSAYPPSQIPGSLVCGLPPPPPFRPGMQFNPVANFQNLNSGVPPPGVASGGVMTAAPGSMPPTYQPQQPGQLSNPAVMRPFTPMANGYPGIHGVAPPGSIPSPAS